MLVLMLSTLAGAAAQCCEGMGDGTETGLPANTAAACKASWTLNAACATGTPCMGFKCTMGTQTRYGQQCLTADGAKAVYSTMSSKMGATCADYSAASAAKASNASTLNGIGRMLIFTMMPVALVAALLTWCERFI